jgi:hypothetical protein
MSASDRALFEAVAGDLLEELGYETEGRRRISLPERAMWSLHHRFWWTMYRLRPRIPGQRLLTFLQLQLADLRRSRK